MTHPKAIPKLNYDEHDLTMNQIKDYATYGVKKDSLKITTNMA